MFYYSPEVDMVDVLAIGGPKPWMDSPKQPSLSPSNISASSPYFYESPESIEKQIPDSPSDWYPFFHSSAASLSPYHNFLHYPSPRFQTLQQLRKSPGNMLSEYYLTTHDMASRENLSGMPPRMESQHHTTYTQSVSPFMARPDFKGTLSSNGSTYCESDLDSPEPIDDTFTTRTADTHCSLVHPIPKSSVHIAANNISFLSSSEDAPSLSSFKIQNNFPEEPDFSGQPCQVPNSAHYSIGAPLTHAHNTHLMASPSHADAKPSTYEETSTWAPWGTGPANYGWCPNRDINDTTYNVPWPVPNNPYTHPEAIYDLPIPFNGINNEPPIVPSSHPPNALTSPSPLIYQSGPSASVHQTGPVEVLPRHYLPTQSPYIASPHNIYSDTDIGSPFQKPLGSFSPSSFTPSTPEEGPSPQQAGDEQTAIEANMHYSDERNAFLIDCKRRGLSYKDIKRVGGFKEAESTLRGRYRTLTKSKDQRVRKPKWQDKDVRLLCEAVSINAETPDKYSSLTNMGMTMNEPPKVSWKKVAEHIWNHGGSYHFGNATCKKKWCEIHNISI